LALDLIAEGSETRRAAEKTKCREASHSRTPTNAEALRENGWPRRRVSRTSGHPDGFEELSRIDYFGYLPLLRKVEPVARYQIVGPAPLRAFQQAVVGVIRADRKALSGIGKERGFWRSLQETINADWIKGEFPAMKDSRILTEYRLRYAKLIAPPNAGSKTEASLPSSLSSAETTPLVSSTTRVIEQVWILARGHACHRDTRR